jgi:NAD-dependent deacetylase
MPSQTAPSLAQVAPRSRFPRVVTLTGAGISAAAGIPTFRGPDGRWALSPQLEEAMHGDRVPGNTAALWEVWGAVLAQAEQAGPTPAHWALAASGATVITQNVDALHTAARTESLFELHGSAARARCLNPGRVWRTTVSTRSPEANSVFGCGVADAIIDDHGLPHCPECGELVRPDVVLFEEDIPPQALHGSMRALERCDLFLAVGTSGVVAPASTFAAIASRAGAVCVCLTLDPPLARDPSFDFHLIGDAQEQLPRWLES